MSVHNSFELYSLRTLTCQTCTTHFTSSPDLDGDASGSQDTLQWSYKSFRSMAWHADTLALSHSLIIKISKMTSWNSALSSSKFLSLFFSFSLSLNVNVSASSFHFIFRTYFCLCSAFSFYRLLISSLAESLYRFLPPHYCYCTHSYSQPLWGGSSLSAASYRSWVIFRDTHIHLGL